MGEQTKIVMKMEPGSLTPERAFKLQQAYVDLLNAVANDLHPNCGEMFKITNCTWVDDGVDEVTFQIVSPGPAS